MIRKFCPSLFVAVILSLLAIQRMQGFEERFLFIHKTLPSYTVELDEKSSAILQQPFYFIGSGRQCFAFESADEKWVIKFINQSRFDFPSFLLQLPFPNYFLKKLHERQQRRKKRISSFFQSYLIAFTDLAEETAMSYCHFSTANLPSMILLDPIGKKHRIEITNTWFVLQKKMTPLVKALEMSRQDVKWEKLIRSFISLLITRCQKGIVDDDLNVQGNIGVVQDQVYLLDPGRLFYDEKVKQIEGCKKEILKSTKLLKKWIQKNQPEKLSLFENLIEEEIQSLSENNLTG